MKDFAARRRALVAFSIRGSTRLGGFTISTLLLASSSLVLMPATIRAAGLESWSSIVLAQALAQIVVLVAGYGYGFNGPTVIATLAPEEGVRYFLTTQRTRLVVALPCFAVAIATMFIVPNADPITGLIGAAPVALATFTATFYFVGRAAPRQLLMADTGPRVTLSLAGAIVLWLGGPLLIGLALPAAGTLTAIVVSNMVIRNSAGCTAANAGSRVATTVRAELRRQLHPLLSSLLRGGVTVLPVLLVTAVAAELVAAFGIFDRIRRQALAGFAPVTLTLQGWVPRRIASEGNVRPVLAAIAAGFVTALLSLLLFVLSGSTIVGWLSAHRVEPTFAEIFLCGSAIATAIIVQVNDTACLIPLRQDRGVFVGNAIGVITVIFTLLALLTIERSLACALGALVVANTVQILVQLLLATMALRAPAKKGTVNGPPKR